MGSFWASSPKDKIWNGAILGASIGIAAYMGEGILDLVESILPDSWMIFGTFSPVAYLIAIGAIVGLIIDYR